MGSPSKFPIAVLNTDRGILREERLSLAHNSRYVRPIMAGKQRPEAASHRKEKSK